MIEVYCDQGSDEWLQARAGACTASRFCDARARVDGLDDRQLAYVKALKSGMPKIDAIAAAGYQKAPSAKAIERALAGERVDRPSDIARAYAWLLAFERVSGQPLDDTFVTWAMRRGRELEPVARLKYEARMGVGVSESGIFMTDDRLFGYSTDGEVIGQPGGIEIKVPASTDKLGAIWSHPDLADEEYLDQCDGGIWLRHWQWIDLVVYCPWLESVGKDLFVKRIWRDEERIASLESDLMEFQGMTAGFEAVLRRETPTHFERLAAARSPMPPVGTPCDVPLRRVDVIGTFTYAPLPKAIDF